MHPTSPCGRLRRHTRGGGGSGSRARPCTPPPGDPRPDAPCHLVTAAVERREASALRRGARARLASVPKRASQARQGAAIRTERRLGAPLPLGPTPGGRSKEAPPAAPKVEQSTLR